jgi:integral membrane protein
MSTSAIGRLRQVGKVEGVSFLVLLFGAMPLKYLAGMPLPVKIVGWVHGLLFIWFCWALLRARAGGLPLPLAALAFVAALLPFGPFLVDDRLRRETAPEAIA